MEKIICGMKFEMPKNGAKLLENYLQEVKNLIKEKRLNQDLYNDIENRMAEKLSASGEITDIVIVNMLNDLGDAREIFGQEQNLDTSGTNYVDGKYSPVILGVFSYFANKYDISVWALRIAYLVVLFGFSKLGPIWFLLNVVVYAALGVKFNKEINIKGGFKGAVVSMYDFIRLCLSIIWKVIKFVFKNFFIVAFMFFAFCFGISALVFGPVFLTDVTRQNQIMFVNVSNFFTYGLIAGGLVLCVLGTAALLSFFNKKFLSMTFVFILVGMGFLSIASIFYGAYQSFGKYSQVFEDTYKLDLGEFTGSDSLKIGDFSLDESYDISRHGFFHGNFSYPNFLRIEKSPDSQIHIQINSSINGESKSQADYIFSKLNKMNFYISGNVLNLSRSGDNLFTERVPFSFLRSDVVLQVPENLTLSTTGNRFGYLNTNNMYSTGYFTSCYDASISYDKEKDQFVCQNQEAEQQGCKDYLVDSKSECIDYINSFEIKKCESVLRTLTGEVSSFTNRQVKDYKYCNDVLSRKRTRFCNAMIAGTGDLANIPGYDQVLYCQSLQTN